MPRSPRACPVLSAASPRLGSRVRQGLHSQPQEWLCQRSLGPSKLLWMKASSGNLSLSGTAWALLGHTENPLTLFWGLNTGLASGRNLIALHVFCFQ